MAPPLSPPWPPAGGWAGGWAGGVGAGFGVAAAGGVDVAGCFSFGGGAGVTSAGVVCGGAGPAGAVAAGTAGSVSVVSVGGGLPSLSACVAARCFSIARTWVMKSWKISAGKVPPATGSPRYSVFIERSLFG